MTYFDYTITLRSCPQDVKNLLLIKIGGLNKAYTLSLYEIIPEDLRK